MNICSVPILRACSALLLLAATTLLGGCAKAPPPLVQPKPPDVFVELPIIRGIVDYEDFTGRTEGFKVVDIRPEVTGKLKEIHFRDGDFVDAGNPLFEIDDTLYRAQRNNAAANLEVAKARVVLNKQLLASAAKAQSSSAIAKDEYVKAEAELKVAEATEDVARAHLEETETTLGYTHITAPYTGRISFRRVDPGNTVKANETVLTRLVVIDPIYVTFDIDERTLLGFRKLIASGKLTSSRDTRVDVLVGLADEDGFSFTATLTFADNTLDVSTGTLRFRAEMKNPSLQHGALPALVGPAAAAAMEQKGLKLLSPGMFIRVRFPVGKEHPGILVPEEALGSDQGHRFVYVLNDKDEAVYRRIKLGPLEGRYRVIEEGVSIGERVIVSGLQRVRANAKVNPKLMKDGKPVIASVALKQPTAPEKK